LIAQIFAEQVGIDPTLVEVSFSPASVMVTVKIPLGEMSLEVDTGFALMQTKLSTKESATAFLSRAGITVVATPMITQEGQQTGGSLVNGSLNSDRDLLIRDSDSSTAIAVVICSAVGSMILFLAVVFWCIGCKKMKRAQTLPRLHIHHNVINTSIATSGTVQMTSLSSNDANTPLPTIPSLDLPSVVKNDHI